MKKVVQVRRLRFVPLHRKSSTKLRPGDTLEVVKVKPSRRFRSGRQLPERVTIQVRRELPLSDFDIISAEHR